MVAVALVLLLAVVLIVADIAMGEYQALTLEVFGNTIETSVEGLFISGIASGILSLGALVMLRVGVRRSWQRHRRMRDLERRAADDELLDEYDDA